MNTFKAHDHSPSAATDSSGTLTPQNAVKPNVQVTSNWTDEKQLRMLARDLSRMFRRQIGQQANDQNVPSIKYKHQWLLEEVISDMQTFV